MALYHEKQQWQFCAVHACNNLLQRQMFTKESFDEICKSLHSSDYFNPHKSFWGTGNYDVNVLINALQVADLEVIWFDKRKGIVVNSLTSFLWGFNSRHWVAIREFNSKWYNMDSKFDEPMEMQVQELLNYLKEVIEDSDGNILIVNKKLQS